MTEYQLESKSLEWLLESATDAMVIADQNGKLILVNLTAEKVFGYLRHELIGKQLEILLPERFRRAHSDQRVGFFNPPHARNMGAGVELFGRRQDSSEFPVDVSLSPLRTEHGLLVMATI